MKASGERSGCIHDLLCAALKLLRDFSSFGIAFSLSLLVISPSAEVACMYRIDEITRHRGRSVSDEVLGRCAAETILMGDSIYHRGTANSSR